MPEQILVGMRVRHIGCEMSPARGEGEVVGRWGNWYFCRNCYEKIVPNTVLTMARTWGGPGSKELTETKCPECLQEHYPMFTTVGDMIFG